MPVAADEDRLGDQAVAAPERQAALAADRDGGAEMLKGGEAPVAPCRTIPRPSVGHLPLTTGGAAPPGGG
jgi:hypothetical protein